MLRTLVVTLTIMMPAAYAHAGALGIGAAVQGQPALSVQYAPGAEHAYHVLTHIGNDTALVQADFQRFFRPQSLRLAGLNGSVYAGLGLTGEAMRDTVPSEGWSLHLPIGLQAEIEALHLSVFAEAAAKVGPLPGTNLSSAVSGGVRAYF